MVLDEIRPGLHRWTAPHPEWVPSTDPESPSYWPEEVGCVAWEAPDALVLIDPLVPAKRESEFWGEIDVLARDRVAVLTTIGFHRRSRDRFVERYDASTSRAKTSLPEGVETIPLRGFGETMVWLPRPRALVPGDRLLGDGHGGLRICPRSWMRYLRGRPTVAELRQALRPLLDLPVELVLVSHWEPVLHRGREQIARALETPASKRRARAR
jgi:hypothetical protein